MTDPKFKTWAEVEAWDRALSLRLEQSSPLIYITRADNVVSQIARVRAAHSHLLKGNDDASI